MSVEDFFNYLESTTFLGVSLLTILLIVATGLIAFILERTITRYLRRFGKRANLAPDVTNSLVLTFRLLILIGATVSIVRAGGLPTEWFVAFSALGGAAVGFASTKTIGNFIAGLYLFMVRPFKVGDYVRVGTVEGIVKEITINYSKILTIGNNVVSISNLQILDRDITSFSYESAEHENLICYTFEIGLSLNVSTDKIAEIFHEVSMQYSHMVPKNPSYMLVRSDGFHRVYMVYLYVKKPEDILILRSRIAEEVLKRWDAERTK